MNLLNLRSLFRGRMKRVVLVALFLNPFYLSGRVFAVEIPQWWKEVHQYDPARDAYDYLTYSTSCFGPNALPVPELYDGRLPEQSQVEVTLDEFWGFGDQTQSLSTRWTYVPKFGNLAVSCWGVLAEHYKTTAAVRDQRASIVESGEETILIGDLYLSTLIGLLREKKYVPDLHLEMVLKTSASKSPFNARFFDTPGYWFDLTAGKSIQFTQSWLREIRLVGTLGFLCYQLNNANQNDAPLYGGKIIFSSGKWSSENGIHGYSGWLKQGDKPMVLRSKLGFTNGKMQYFLQFQHALRDYPYRRIQTGVSIDF